MSQLLSTYRGRFAPSPTGELHWGSLITALASWLEARRHDGVWLIRMDDLDYYRCVPGAAELLLNQLSDLGLEPDEPVYYQSQRTPEYQAATRQLLASGHAFHCPLSRRELQARGGSHPGPETAVPAGTNTTLRMAVPDQDQHFNDRFQGPQTENLHSTGGAFTLQRRDGPYSYQLACALDEAWLGITEVVRGADLLTSSFRQQWILQCLGLPVPEYGHLPVLLDSAGHKLSKSEGADPVDPHQPAATLTRALTLLEQQPPRSLAGSSATAVLTWARTHWHPRPLIGLQQKYAQPGPPLTG